MKYFLALFFILILCGANSSYDQGINAKFDEILINYADALSELGYYQPAQKAYLRAMDANKGSVSIFNKLALMADDRADFESAIYYYKKVLELDPKFEDAYFSIAIAYANVKKYAEAKEALKKLLVLNPKAKDAEAFLEHIKPAK